MKRLRVKSSIRGNSVILQNEFIDRYMPKANGEYVKVYLLILRHTDSTAGSLNITKIADILDLTEKDVKRALRYWQKEGLVELAAAKEPPANNEAPTETDPQTSPDQPADVPNIAHYRNRKEQEKELKEMLFIAESYLGKTLSYVEAETIAYIQTELDFSVELMDYLIEYCVENGHKSIHYIRKVALNWAERKIVTVEEAKSIVVPHNKKCYSILRAFGISGRAPATAETSYIKRWCEEYHFSMEIILEACNRTINAIHKPSFDYADKILTDWSAKGVTTMEDVKLLDSDFIKAKESRKKTTRPATAQSGSKFNNFEERSYDMDDLEKQLIQ